MRRFSNLYYLIISAFIVAFDQITKKLITANYIENDAVPVIGDLLQLRLVYNEGGAMGTILGPSWLYTILTLAALFFIVRYFLRAHSDGRLVKWSLALILGGAIGNLIDRLRFGRVVDFVDMDIPDVPFLGLYRWYTYNVADAAITIGLVLFAVALIITKATPEKADGKLPEVQAPVHTDPPGR
jgi:signal peptidase II